MLTVIKYILAVLFLALILGPTQEFVAVLVGFMLWEFDKVMETQCDT